MGTEKLKITASGSAVYPNQDLTFQIIGAAMEVHRELASGFLEKVSEKALAIELKRRQIRFTTQVPIPVLYKGESPGAYYADFIVDGRVLLELKALDALASVHSSQVIHYLKATGVKVGLLLNFGAAKLEVKRLVL